jgi:hypothetical protein
MKTMRCAKLLPAWVAALAVAACGTTQSTAIPDKGTLLPNATIAVSPHVSYTLEQVAMAGLAGAVLYIVYDPLAPNWKIEEKVLNEDTYFLSMQAKSFRTGGDGEAIRLFKRRALQLQRERGYSGYRILDYSEGVESSTPLTHRVSEGTIQLVRVDTTPKR